MTEEMIRERIRKLFSESPMVHMDVSLTKPKLVLNSAEARITGVFPHFFQIEEDSQGYTRHHSLKYTEVMIGHIVIKELA